MHGQWFTSNTVSEHENVTCILMQDISALIKTLAESFSWKILTSMSQITVSSIIRGLTSYCMFLRSFILVVPELIRKLLCLKKAVELYTVLNFDGLPCAIFILNYN